MQITSMVESRDGKYLVTAATDSTARLWELETGRELRQFADPTDLTLASKSVNAITSMALSPDMKYLATAGTDKTRLWEIATGR